MSVPFTPKQSAEIDSRIVEMMTAVMGRGQYATICQNIADKRAATLAGLSPQKFETYESLGLPSGEFVPVPKDVVSAVPDDLTVRILNDERGARYIIWTRQDGTILSRSEVASIFSLRPVNSRPSPPTTLRLLAALKAWATRGGGRDAN